MLRAAHPTVREVVEMDALLDRGGSVLGVLGVILCVLAGVVRLLGSYAVLGFDMFTLFNVGMGLMVTACLAKLHLLTRRRPPPG